MAARSVRNAQDLYRTTSIWHAHLSFTREQWKALESKRIGPMPNFDRPEGLMFLRNPQARRSGIAGVLGFEFDWTHANFELGGVASATSRRGSKATCFRCQSGLAPTK